MDQNFNNYLANIQANASQPTVDPTQQPTAPQAPPTGGGNWLTHLLPTGGAIGGGIGGAALGSAILPGIGTIAGGILGAAFGSGGGKAAENATEGKGVDNGVGTAAVEGGVGQALGGVAGKVLGKGAELLAGSATNVAGKTAAQDAIDTAANTYKDVNLKLQGNLNAKSSLNHVTNMGYDITDPTNLSHVSNTSNDILNDVLNKSLNEAGPVNLSNYDDIVKTALAKVDPNGNILGNYDPVGISTGRLGLPNTPAAKVLTQLQSLGAGVAKPNADPNEIRTLITNLGAAAKDAKPMPTAATGAVDPAQRTAYNAINEVRNQVKSGLYDRPEVNDALTALQGNILPNEAQNLTPQLADHLNGVISGAGTNGNSAAQDLLSEISKNININDLGKEGSKVGEYVTSVGAKNRAATAAGLGVNTESSLGNAMQQIAVNHSGGPVSTVTKALLHSANNPGVLNALSRVGMLTSKAAPTAGVLAATAPNLGADSVSATGTPDQGGTMGAAMQPQTQNPLDQLYQTLLQNYQAGGGITPNDASIAGTLATLAPQVQKQNLVAGELSAIPGSFANAGGAQGAGGIMSRIAGLIPGTAAHTYQQQQEGTAQALASQLGISPQAAMGLLPQLMNNQATAGQNQGVLSQLTGQLAY